MWIVIFLKIGQNIFALILNFVFAFVFNWNNDLADETCLVCKPPLHLWCLCFSNWNSVSVSIYIYRLVGKPLLQPRCLCLSDTRYKYNINNALKFKLRKKIKDALQVSKFRRRFLTAKRLMISSMLTTTSEWAYSKVSRVSRSS